MKATTFLILGIATLEIVLSGAYASRGEWGMSAFAMFFGCVTLYLGVNL